MAVTFGVEIAEARQQQTRSEIANILQCRRSKMPLVAAVANGDVGQVAALLAGGANPNEVDDWVDAVGVAVMTKRRRAPAPRGKRAPAARARGGDTEDDVFLAALGGSADVLNVLLAAPGASVSGPRAQYAFAGAQFGHADARPALIAAGADPNAVPLDNKGTTPVSVAARHGDAATLKVLVDAGAGVEKSNISGSSRSTSPLRRATPRPSSSSSPPAPTSTRRGTRARPPASSPASTATSTRSTRSSRPAATCAKVPTRAAGVHQTAADVAAQNGHQACLTALLAAGAAPPADWDCDPGDGGFMCSKAGASLVIKTKNGGAGPQPLRSSILILSSI
ncbi:hypothetical protein SO694_00066116 [Aureococcus anophagefferens]|uniref:Uncharacterized protein n=1 Tax=Aureococcus anophagefferens TaxID=44056 RepID=A0ABR1FQ86_AURAN